MFLDFLDQIVSVGFAVIFSPFMTIENVFRYPMHNHVKKLTVTLFLCNKSGQKPQRESPTKNARKESIFGTAD